MYFIAPVQYCWYYIIFQACKKKVRKGEREPGNEATRGQCDYVYQFNYDVLRDLRINLEY